MTNKNRSRLFALALTALAQSAAAGSLVVNTLDDEFLADGDCSLREAVYAANNDISVDECGIGRRRAGYHRHFALRRDQPDRPPPGRAVTRHSRFRLDRDSHLRSEQHRVFEVDMSSTSHDLTLEDLSIEQGFSDDFDGGAGMLASCVDVLRLDRVRMTGHSLDDATGAPGAAIHLAPDFGCNARLEVNASLFSDNRASIGVGGAIYVSNTGGGVRSAQITATQFSDNLAAGDGGAIFAYHLPTLSIEDVLFSGNSIDDESNPNGRGGAISLRSQDHESGNALTLIERSSFIGNSAGANGGAISLDGPLLASIRNSTFHDNAVAGPGGEALGRRRRLDRGLFPVHALQQRQRFEHGSHPGRRDGGSISLNHTIIATSWNTTLNCDGDISSNGFNIDSGSSCTSEASDLSNTDPDLAPASVFSDPGLPFDLPILMPSVSSPATDGGTGPLVRGRLVAARKSTSAVCPARFSRPRAAAHLATSAPLSSNRATSPCSFRIDSKSLEAGPTPQLPGAAALPLSSRLSQARANCQSRLAVAGEIFSDWAVSSKV